jgi:hypothetical protein
MNNGDKLAKANDRITELKTDLGICKAFGHWQTTELDKLRKAEKKVDHTKYRKAWGKGWDDAMAQVAIEAGDGN